MQISIGITVKVIEVQCATVSEVLSGKLTKSVVNKCKHDDDVEDVEMIVIQDIQVLHLPRR